MITFNRVCQLLLLSNELNIVQGTTEKTNLAAVVHHIRSDEFQW